VCISYLCRLMCVVLTNSCPNCFHSSLFDRCASTGKAIPKDKAIKRFIVRNIVDASSLRDIKEASAYQEYQLPKLYLKMYYCVEAAVHQRIVRGRSREARRIRTPPERKFVRKN
jgi:small subunit ribosomal protein S26e